MTPARYLSFIVVLLLLFSVLCPVVAGESGPAGATAAISPGSNPPEQKTSNGPVDPAEVEAFLDTIMPANLARYNVPGATVAVVKDGRLIVAKGYGYSDITNKTRVDASTTTFRIGSITKLFTWTSVMQLESEGKINLDADVNTYLNDFKIPDTYPGHPVTMRTLMTHTAGFEDAGIHTSVEDVSDLYSFRDYCRDNIPARVFPPGQVASYSNYGTTLAAVIIEDVSGEPFEQYIQSHILTPLAMDQTNYREDLPPAAASRLSKGYTYAAPENVAAPDAIYVIGPAGTISSTAPDMAKFLAAHMQNGVYRNATILPKDTAILMHTRAFANDPRVSGVCLGFYEQYYNGIRTFGHGGDTTEFHSQLTILPEQQAGYFVSYNSAGGSKARDEVFTQFMDHYYPAVQPTLPKPDPANVPGLQKYAGSYVMNRHNYAHFEKFIESLTPVVITVSPSGTLLSSGGGEFVEVRPGVFSRTDGTRPGSGDMVFNTTADGSVRSAISANIPILLFDRVPWYATNGFLDNLKLVAGILLATVLLWPLLGAFRRTYKVPEPAFPKPAIIARWVAGAAALILLSFVFILLPLVTGDQELIMAYFVARGVPLMLTAVLTVPVIALCLTVATLGFAALAWVKKYWSVPGRVHYTIVAVAAVAMLYWINSGNLWVWCL